MSRPGDKMLLATQYVADHPGCAILPVAEYVGPHGSRNYGYQVVHRAFIARLIQAEKTKSGKYILSIPQEGK